MSAFVIGIPVPDGLDAKTFRVRVIVDRIDGAELTPDDLKQIQTAYPEQRSKPAPKRRTKSTKPAAARQGKMPRAPGR